MVLLRIIQLLHVEIQRGDTLETGDLLVPAGMLIENLFELIDCLFSVAIIVGCVSAWNVLLGVRGGQVQSSIEQAGIEFDGLLEMRNRLFVLGILVGSNALVELVAGSELIATHATEQREQSRTYHQHP